MSVTRAILGALLESAGDELAELIGSTDTLRKNLQANPKVDDSASAAEDRAAAEDLGETTKPEDP